MLVTRRAFIGTAAAALVAAPLWARSGTGQHADALLIDDIERRTFNFFWEQVNHRNGLMPDRWPTPSFCSITATGFALTAWPIGVERGWIRREQAREITLRTLRFLEQLPQGEQPTGTAGYRGFYYHFLDIDTGL